LPGCNAGILCLVVLLANPAYADIYLQQDSGEEIYLTNLVDERSGASSANSANQRFVLMIAEEKTARDTARATGFQQTALPYSKAVLQAADHTSVDPALLHAVMFVESNNNPNARSPRGARGLMQLMPGTSRRFAVTNPQDPGQNITAGAKYLRELQIMFKGDNRLALAAYNAGPNAVVKHGFKIPPYAETQQYVPKVMAMYRKLSGKISTEGLLQ